MEACHSMNEEYKQQLILMKEIVEKKEVIRVVFALTLSCLIHQIILVNTLLIFPRMYCVFVLHCKDKKCCHLRNL